MRNKKTDANISFCLYCALLIEYFQLDRTLHLINFWTEHKTKYILKLKWNSESGNAYLLQLIFT